MTTWAYTARFRPHTLIACTARQAADAVDAGYEVRLMTMDELLYEDDDEHAIREDSTDDIQHSMGHAFKVDVHN